MSVISGLNPGALAPAPRRVAVVGAANMDILVHTSMGLAPSDSNPGSILCAPGGVGRNVAENLARLGLASQLFSVVGDDVFGQALLAATRQAGVNVSAVSVWPGSSSASYLAWHGSDGDMLAAVNDMGLLNKLTPEVLQEKLSELKQAQMMVLDCNLTLPTLAWLLQSPRLQLLKVNQREASVLSGMQVETTGQACLAALLLHRAGVKQVVVSLGGDGVAWCDADGQTGHRPAHKVAVVNTSGAGDALLAGLVLCCSEGLPLPQAVQGAMACAEITLASPHANSPHLAIAALRAHLGDAGWRGGDRQPNQP
ncbi:MAG: PfkB family carbohydrate kinase [Burkholderiales bacterium]|nr:PfkB family carbohydrate kinase [Burkholderiales bacterium]